MQMSLQDHPAFMSTMPSVTDHNSGIELLNIWRKTVLTLLRELMSVQHDIVALVEGLTAYHLFLVSPEVTISSKVYVLSGDSRVGTAGSGTPYQVTGRAVPLGRYEMTDARGDAIPLAKLDLLTMMRLCEFSCYCGFWTHDGKQLSEQRSTF